MESLKQAYQRAIQTWSGMGRTVRLVIGSLVVLALVSLIFLRQVPGWGGDVYLFGARVLTDEEVSRMEAAFAAAGLEEGTFEGNRVKVPQRERARYVAALTAAEAMPEQPGEAYDAIYEMNHLLESRTVTDSRLKRASERSLAYTLRGLNGIQHADVKIEELDRGGFPRKREARAVASVRADAQRWLDRHQVQTVRDIVAHGGGVTTENVVVVDLNANRSFRGNELDTMPEAELADPYLARQRAHEDLTRRRIEDVLIMYPGAVVSVRMELVPAASLVSGASLTPTPGQPMIGSAQTVSDMATFPASIATESKPAGDSNRLSQTPSRTTVEAGVRQQDPASESLVNEAWLPRARASILLPRSLFRQIWWQEQSQGKAGGYREPDQRQLAAIESRVMRDVQDAVAPLLPMLPGESALSLVTVRAFTPPETRDALPSESTQVALTWLTNHGQTVGGLLLVAVLLGCIHRLIRPANNARPAATAAVAENESTRTLSMSAARSRREAENQPSQGLSESGDETLRHELAALVHERPEQAARVIAEWLDDAA